MNTKAGSVIACILTLLMQKSMITDPDESTVPPQVLKLKLNFSETCKFLLYAKKCKKVIKKKKIKSTLLVIRNFEHQARSGYMIIIRRPSLLFSYPRNRIGMNMEVNSGDYHVSIFLSFNMTSWGLLVSYHFPPPWSLEKFEEIEYFLSVCQTN